MAMRASKGPVDEAVVVGSAVRSVVEEPSRSPADRDGPELGVWSWDAE